MAEGEMTSGEIERSFARHDKRFDDQQRQITELARETVSATAFTQAIAALRQDQADDRAQAEVLAKERHRAVLTRLGNLETAATAKPMNSWTKASIVLVAVLGMLGLAVTFYVGTHH